MTRYSDPLATFDFGSEHGEYVVSYATEHHLVEAHIFRKDGHVVVYVTKSPGVSVAAAQQVADAAVQQYVAGASAGVQDMKVVYDGYSLGRSGSL